jgi:hypothetical protein
MATERALVAAPDPEKRLAEYKTAGCNIVVASMNLHVTDPRLMVDFKVVPVNPNPDGGDVHKMPGGDKMILARPALERIALCAGINWDPRLTGVVGQITRDFVAFRAVGYLRSDSGETITLTATKAIDMGVIEEEIRAEQTVKVFNKGNDNYRSWNRRVHFEDLTQEQQKEAENATRREVTAFRKHMVRRAETGAKLAAIRSIGIKSGYTKEELQRPFVIARTVPNPHDPMVRASMRKAALSLYGDADEGDPGTEPFPEAEDAESEDVGTTREPEGEQEAEEYVSPPATCKQVALILRMIRSHHFTQEEREAAEAYCEGDPSLDQAKRFIDRLTGMLKDREAAEKKAQEPAQEAPKAAPPPSDPAQPENAPPEPAAKGKVYLDEAAAKELVRYANEFGVTGTDLLHYCGSTYGVTEFEELTTEDEKALRVWIQGHRPATTGKARR